ncbi:uncharacterized protein LACBIDRAFT_325578 [Laccaria bicolor S238N-H82]|uniref:Predicted protein n=1 Tax=Laccaria bicolor (strain S238N-H82 / ATCC MYA-4686) TaxID=486041 RepID=B0D5I8_LACBS|nr:uncharacterized protein LACBIDRAFT_325578 [Laccaria bicolor S238N-H82]EDR10031.1 predicted protein [Laccaria bicolor S238N-H82]|eukprot:XP_001879416.1 predicted protein [Laccaria bicolor S238N-H82]
MELSRTHIAGPVVVDAQGTPRQVITRHIYLGDILAARIAQSLSSTLYQCPLGGALVTWATVSQSFRKITYLYKTQNQEVVVSEGSHRCEVSEFTLCMCQFGVAYCFAFSYTLGGASNPVST